MGIMRKALFGSVAGLALIPAPAFAQQTQTDAAQEEASSRTDPLPPLPGDDEIVVTGIRESLRASQDIKKNSAYIVDAITQEDIGKFPSANVGEALQQVPGIAISRSGGEGQQITVRGLGPQFNTVLLNGRRLASDAGDRAFNFDTISSDLLGGTEVYKTTNVALQEGGIGATIDLKTLRPFDLKEPQVVLSARGLYDDLANRLTPQVFGLIGGSFADDRFGALLSISYQRRKNVREVASADSWQPYDVTDTSVFAPGQGNGAGRYWAPAKYVNDYFRGDRERLGINATVQGRITDDLVLTVDGLYSKFKVKSQAIEKAQFVNLSSVVPGSVVTDTNQSITKFSYVNGPEFVKITENRPTDLYAFGGNLAWQVTPYLTSTLDISGSRANDKNGGNDQYFVIHGPDTQMTYDDTGGFDTPVGTDGEIIGYDPVVFPAGSPQSELAPPVGSVWDRNNVNGYRSWWTTRQGNTTKDRVFEARWDTKWSPDNGGWFNGLRFGAAYSDQKKDVEQIGAGDVGWSNYGAMGIPLPGSLFYTDNHPGFLGTANTPNTGKFINFDGESLIDYLLSPAALTLRDQLNGLPPGTSAATILPRGYAAVPQPGSSYGVQEKVISAYAEVSLAGDIGAMPLSVNIGARYTRTRQRANSQQHLLLDILNAPGSGGTQYVSVFSPDFEPVSKRNEYDNFLPSINAKLDVTRNLVLRAAASKSLTRPDLGALNPVVVYPETLRPGNLTASGGGGDLKPYTSINLDASAEWYYSATGYVSVAYFHKKVDGLIVNSVVPYQVTIPNADNIADTSIQGSTATFNLATSVNLGSVNVSGVEIAVQHTFDYLPSVLRHFGFTASITLPSTNREFDRSSFNNGGAMPGLSNSYFVAGFYDDGRFEARVNWARRDTYFNRLVTGTEPEFVLGSSQWDARAGFNLTPKIQLFADAFNFTNTPYRTVGRYTNQFITYQETGARYDAGVRFKF